MHKPALGARARVLRTIPRRRARGPSRCARAAPLRAKPRAHIPGSAALELRAPTSAQQPKVQLHNYYNNEK